MVTSPDSQRSQSHNSFLKTWVLYESWLYCLGRHNLSAYWYFHFRGNQIHLKGFIGCVLFVQYSTRHGRGHWSVKAYSCPQGIYLWIEKKICEIERSNSNKTDRTSIKKITRQSMINCKHALGERVPFRIRKFWGFFVCCFYKVKVAFLKNCSHWLNKAEESNGCYSRQVSKFDHCEHRLSSKTQWIPMSSLLCTTDWETCKNVLFLNWKSE